MNIYEKLIKTLKTEEIIKYTDKNRVYYNKIYDKTINNNILYTIIKEKEAYCEDMIEEYSSFLIQIDLFSNINLIEIESEIKKSLLVNGFKKVEVIDGFNEEVKYHKIFRYEIIL